MSGTLYGTTESGDLYDGGTVFAFDPTTAMETQLYSFCTLQNCTDGEDQKTGLIDVKGSLHGTTYPGGACNNGTLI